MFSVLRLSMCSIGLLVFLSSLPAQVDFSDPVNLGRSTAEADVGDFDQDGNPDIFVCGAMQRWFAGPDFTAEYTLGVSTGGPYAAKVADFNNDGYPDVVTSDGARNSPPGNTYLYLNPGTDGDVFGEWQRITIYTGDVRHQNDLKVADLDGDGRLDVVTRSWSDQRVMLYFQNADINNWTARILGDNMGNKEEGLSVGDVDGEPGLEIVLSGVYWKADDWRTVTDPSIYTIDANFIGTVFGKVKSAIDDIDGDGDPDVYMGTAEGSVKYLAWHRNEGIGPDGGVIYTTQIIENFGDAHLAELEDYDGDGDPDLWIGRSFGSSGIYVYLNDGNGNFTRNDIDANGKMYYGSIDDLDGDGDLDLVGPPSFYRNGTNIYYNESDNTPRAGAVTISPNGGTYVEAVSVSLAAAQPFDEIRYTTDGSTPDASSTLYDLSFSVVESSTIRAISIGAGLLPSAVSSATFTIAVGGNFPPVANAGPDQTSTDFSPITLDGSGSTDQDDDPTLLTYAWAQTAGPAVALSDPNQATTTFTPAETGTYTFQLTVSDEADSDSDELTIRVTDLDASLIAYWPMDEQTGADAGELVSGQDAALNAGATFAPTDGRVNGAVLLNGTSGRLTAPAIDVPGSAMTITAWVNPSSLASVEGRILSKASGAVESQHYWMLSQIGGSALRFRLKTDGATTTLASPTGLLTTNEWQLITATYDGSTIRIYRNATEIASTQKSGAITAEPSVTIAIGNQPAGAGDRPFAGLIDEVKIYDVALSQAEIAALADAVLPVRWQHLAAYPFAKGIRLDWSVANQSDNAGFAVERLGANAFQELAFLPSSTSTEYAYQDDTPRNGTNTYRLRQVDLDGSIEYSPQVTAIFSNNSLKVAPNPVVDQLRIIELEAMPGTRYTLLNASGESVQTGTIGGSGVIDVSYLRPGAYVLLVNGESIRFVKR